MHTCSLVLERRGEGVLQGPWDLGSRLAGPQRVCAMFQQHPRVHAPVVWPPLMVRFAASMMARSFGHVVALRLSLSSAQREMGRQ